MGEIHFKIDLETGDLTIDDEYVGKRTLKAGNCVGCIFDQLRVLRKIKKRGTSPKPRMLRDDIRAYEILLTQPDPEQASADYLERREQCQFSKTKKQILTEMGIWK